MRHEVAELHALSSRRSGQRFGESDSAAVADLAAPSWSFKSDQDVNIAEKNIRSSVLFGDDKCWNLGTLRRGTEHDEVSRELPYSAYEISRVTRRNDMAV